MKNIFTYFDDFLTMQKSQNKSPLTIKSYSFNGRHFIKFLVQNFRVELPVDIRRSHLDSFQHHLKEKRTRKGIPIKPRTINRSITAARNFLGFLAKRGHILSALVNHLVYVKEPQLLPTGILDDKQVRALLRKIDTSTAKGYRNRTILELMYTSGIRANELVLLDVNSVNLDNKTMLVFGKGSKERIVPIGKTAMKYLENYIRSIRPFLGPQQDENALFLNSQGDRLQYRPLLRIVHNCTDDLGFDISVTPHVFRRSCTTEMVKSGANLYHVKDLLGHESLDTLKHYTKLTITDLQKTHKKHHPRG